MAEEHPTRSREMTPGPLRARIKATKAATRLTLDDLTALAPNNDPYRCDTGAGHRDAQWLVDQLQAGFPDDRPVHLRGLHYSIVARGNVLKPNGERYINDDADWTWLVNRAAKSARWLGYIPFDRFTDNRNAAPELVTREELAAPLPALDIGPKIELPDPASFTLRPVPIGFEPRQAFALSIFGEKSSLRAVLAPLCRQLGADLYLPSGEMSDTLIYTMAQRGAEDGRPMVLLTLSDADPSGWQMPVSLARKLQALRDLAFPTLDFRVVPVALTAAQAADLDLPSTPLKEGERRADKWREAFGREQTEIDALEALRPDLLAQMVRDAAAPYFDATLRERVWDAKWQWEKDARQAIQNTAADDLASVRTLARAILPEQRAYLDALKSQLFDAAAKVTPHLPPIVIPTPTTPAPDPSSILLSSEWSWQDQTAALKARKAYE